jgi:hypothetical protein
MAKKPKPKSKEWMETQRIYNMTRPNGSTRFENLLDSWQNSFVKFYVEATREG